jgi:hypothetical protein
MPLPSDTNEKTPSAAAAKVPKLARFKAFVAVVYPCLPYLFPLAAAVLTLVNTHILLGPELNRSGDNEYHILNEFAILRGILGGDNPLGPVAMEFGQPVARFYQALFYLWNVAMALITGLSFYVHVFLEKGRPPPVCRGPRGVCLDDLHRRVR